MSKITVSMNISELRQALSEAMSSSVSEPYGHHFVEGEPELIQDADGAIIGAEMEINLVKDNE